MSQLEHGAAVRRTRAGLATLESGATEDPAVVLIPGYTGSKEDFAPLLDPIAASGRHAVALDLPGQYESPPQPAGDGYAPDVLAGRIRAVLDELAADDTASAAAPVELVGHSFGGLVARAAVIGQSHRFGSLTLLSSGPAEIGGMRRTLIELMGPVLAEGGVPGVYAALQAVAPEDAGRSAPLAAFFERRFLAGSADMLEGMGAALSAEPDRVAELAATDVAVLVTHGVDDDAWPPAEQRAMAERLGARYAVIPSAAHSAAIENPAALIEVLLDFWR